MRRLTTLVSLSIACLLIGAGASAAAEIRRPADRIASYPGDEVEIREGGEEVPLEVAELYLELNDTDGDLGIHGLIDGDSWSVLEIEDPRGRTILRVMSWGRMRQQGLTEIFFESDEPAFDELSPEEFFARFPEGTYEIDALSLEGERLGGEAALSHVLAAPPSNVRLTGVPAAENCDAELPLIVGPVVIEWDPVTSSHPELGREGPVEIVRYQVFVEIDETKLAVDLPPDVTEFRVPDEFLELGTEFKFEIIARTAEGNNTAIESCFVTE